MDCAKGYEHRSSGAAILPPRVGCARERSLIIFPTPGSPFFVFSLSLFFRFFALFLFEPPARCPGCLMRTSTSSHEASSPLWPPRPRPQPSLSSSFTHDILVFLLVAETHSFSRSRSLFSFQTLGSLPKNPPTKTSSLSHTRGVLDFWSID